MCSNDNREHKMNQLICYCFEYTEEDIINDFKVNDGKSSILAKITEARRTNTCQCDDKHPEKRCCISDVHRVVERIKKE